MAAFSNYQQQYYPAAPFVLDSLLEPEATSNNMSCFSIDHEGTGFSNSYFLDPDHETYLHQEIPLHADHHQIHESTTRPPLHKSCAAAAAAAAAAHDDPSLSLKHEYHPTNSSVKVVELGSSGTHPVEKKRKNMDTMVERKGRDGKCSGTTVRKHAEERRRRFSKKQKKVAAEVPSGFVHVRARRGQATDSHSLAERVRRQKISVRMKLLQSLVPGCDKMTGKALILDEIIRHVRTLQCQVQFLAAKVASFNPMLNEFEMDINTNPLAQDQEVPLHNLQKTCIMDFEQLQPLHVLESSSTQLFHQEQISSNVTFQDNCNLLWATDDGSRKQEFESQFGLHNLHSF